MPTARRRTAAALGRGGASIRLHQELLRSSTWLLVASLTTSASGFAFWAIAARRFDPVDVGQAAAIFSLTLFVAYATALGLPLGVARFALARDRDSGAVFSWACVLTTATSLVGAAALVWAAPQSLAPLTDEFPAGVV